MLQQCCGRCISIWLYGHNILGQQHMSLQVRVERKYVAMDGTRVLRRRRTRGHLGLPHSGELRLQMEVFV